MKTPTPTYIHVGLPKTATTTLQEHLFANHSQIHYFGKYAGKGFSSTVRPLLVLKFSPTTSWDSSDIRMADIQKQLAYAKNRNLTPLLSEEALGSISPRRKKEQAKRLAKAFGDCQIILVIREPVSFIKSYYLQMLKSFQRLEKNQRAVWMKSMGEAPRYFDINQWMDAVWHCRNSPRQIISYATTAEVYARVFGEKNVKIFIFEEFARNPKQFITSLCDHIGIDPKEGFNLINGKRSNEGMTTGYISRLQEIEQSKSLTEQFRNAAPEERRQMLNPSEQSGEKVRPELSGEWVEKINTIGKKQSRKLVKKWSLPLADYGYQL